ncbi:hypothetical protein [Acinetobacter baumannii]|uniref:hypothetical protein n=1 Tax=Acinetobacter baumannii TaxID=470 RepID=UPI001CA9B244|nr:hypothetical protein [Acinetobacter baumannii]UAB16106.1 hypothetical protein H2786_18325 [Acinetobacter baumannii]
MSVENIFERIELLNKAVRDYFIKLNEHSIWLFLSIMGWIGIPNEQKSIKILALIGIVLFFFYYLSTSKLWKEAAELSEEGGGKTFRDLFSYYKNEVERTDLSADDKNNALNKLAQIENRYFNFRKNGLKIVCNNYCFFFTIGFFILVLFNQYRGLKIW